MSVISALETNTVKIIIIDEMLSGTGVLLKNNKFFRCARNYETYFVFT